jgi:hypothetical protein
MNALVIILGVLIALAVAFVVGLHLYVYGVILFSGLRLRQSLRPKNRVLSLSEAKGKMEQRQGMIIVDAPTLGWNVSRVWWSPTDDFASRPSSWNNDRLCPEEDIINYNRFIEPSSGTAKLIDGFVFTHRVESFLERNFGTSESGFVFLGGVLTQLGLDRKHHKT